MTLAGCTSNRKKTAEDGSPNDGTPPASVETYGPEETLGPFKSADENYGPVRAADQRTTDVVLVLGPGMSRGLAHGGIIQALHQNKLKVSAIYATEMGALVAAAYGTKANLNQLEWALQRVKDNTFPPKGSQERVDSVLKEIFGNQQLQESKIPIFIGLVGDTKAAVDVTSGTTRGLVSAAFAHDNGDLPPVQVHPETAEKFRSAAFIRPNVIAMVRARSTGLIVCVEVVTRGRPCEGADLIIKPILNGFKDDDYGHRAEMIFRGRKATLEALSALSQLLKVPGDAR